LFGIVWFVVVEFDECVVDFDLVFVVEGEVELFVLMRCFVWVCGEECYVVEVVFDVGFCFDESELKVF